MCGRRLLAGAALRQTSVTTRSRDDAAELYVQVRRGEDQISVEFVIRLQTFRSRRKPSIRLRPGSPAQGLAMVGDIAVTREALRWTNAPVTARRRSPLVPGLICTCIVLLLTGCGDSLSVGAMNRCGYAVEVDAGSSTITAAKDPHWTQLADGERSGVRSIREDADRVFFWVRTAADGEVLQFDLAVDELVRPPEGANYEIEIILDGDRCPAP